MLLAYPFTKYIVFYEWMCQGASISVRLYFKQPAYDGENLWDFVEKCYGGPLCQDTKRGFNKSYFPPSTLVFLMHLLMSGGNTLRLASGN